MKQKKLNREDTEKSPRYSVVCAYICVSTHTTEETFSKH